MQWAARPDGLPLEVEQANKGCVVLMIFTGLATLVGSLVAVDIDGGFARNRSNRLASEFTVIVDAVDALPSSQRQVIVLRDIEGLPPAEVCNILGLTDTHQRVLLHRARSRVRHALERYFAETETT